VSLCLTTFLVNERPSLPGAYAIVPYILLVFFPKYPTSPLYNVSIFNTFVNFSYQTDPCNFGGGYHIYIFKNIYIVLPADLSPSGSATYFLVRLPIWIVWSDIRTPAECPTAAECPASVASPTTVWKFSADLWQLSPNCRFCHRLKL
jgi:hypothetical protein